MNNAMSFSAYNGSPWRPANKVYNARAIVELHEEIEDFFHYISPTPEEHNMRMTLVKKLKVIVKQLWPYAQVEIFGSFRTGLYLPTGDIDLVVIGDWKTLPLRTLQDALVKNHVCQERHVRIIDKAAVPLVKFTDSRTNIKVDISFNLGNGVKAAELVQQYKLNYPSLAKLVFVLKQFLLERDLNEVFTGGVSSFSIVLMVVSFLQLHRRADANLPSANLGVLLMEFFELYGRNFNYVKCGISVRGAGGYFAKDQGNYFKKFVNQSPSLLTIEDPLNTGNDIGRGSYNTIQMKQAFQLAYLKLTQAVNPEARLGPVKISVLGRIIRINDAIVDYRKWVKREFFIPQRLMGSGSENSCSEVSSDSE
ncbi:terminal nucleotidyltransferase 4B-like [Nilaparvata lugens]|uniref:terminal nucleotidyltransferase 4B-like n=1 Tax=Nilaparvata lugens TaxID=108931 RepID=UPI00193DBCD7|nr:terminal nucleotidyltransferase 4B-like [Nilaparvata lugens]